MVFFVSKEIPWSAMEILWNMISTDSLLLLLLKASEFLYHSKWSKFLNGHSNVAFDPNWIGMVLLYSSLFAKSSGSAEKQESKEKHSKIRTKVCKYGLQVAYAIQLD